MGNDNKPPGKGNPNNGGDDGTEVCPTEVYYLIEGGQAAEQCVPSGLQKKSSVITDDAKDSFLTAAENEIIAKFGEQCKFDARFFAVDNVFFTELADTVGSKPSSLVDWTLVFDEEFNSPQNPTNNPDLSETIDYRRWSSKTAFANDAKFNTIPGEESHWNLNTTGRYPGEGIGIDNFYGIQDHIDYAENFTNANPIFASTESGGVDLDSLSITAQINPDPNRITNDERPYVSGLISSHSNPDPAKNDSVPPHGFEFRYGYVEMRAKVPAEGNGFRAAFWLYSDNAYYNQLLRRNKSFISNKDRHEIDVMEYLPNSKADATDCYTPQDSLFGGVDNRYTTRLKNTILTYDTLFHTYHYDNGQERTPTNWTFNAEERYASRRTSADVPYIVEEAGYIRYGVLWEKDRIEWYVNDTLVHRVVESGPKIPGFQDVAPVFDKRMYLIANLAMGLDVFEGAEVDDDLFSNGRNPTFEIDYIKVWQDSSNENGHAWFGYDPTATDFGVSQGERCDGTIGLD